MKPVCWVGRFRGNSGFATSTRTYAREVQSRVDEFVAAPLSVLDPENPFYSAVGEIPDSAFMMVNHLPVTDPEADGYFSVWEYDSVPDDWAECFNRASVVLTQSNFCKTVFSQKMDDPSKITVIPYILGEQFLNFDPDGPRFEPPREGFVFGSVFEWVPRKVPWIMLDAFLREFSNDSDAFLVLRTNLPSDDVLKSQLGPAYEGFSQQLGKKIIVIDEPIIDLVDFYRGIDAYLSCSAGEGFGQTLAEALACEKPTLASNHSGPLDFMRGPGAILVDVGEWEPSVAQPQYNFRIPLVEDMMKKMRMVKESWDVGKPIDCSESANWIREQLSPQRIGPMLFDAIREFIE